MVVLALGNFLLLLRITTPSLERALKVPITPLVALREATHSHSIGWVADWMA
jgi:hypothetical protein